jgi:hypothetical protein
VDEHKGLLHVRVAERVMGWEDVSPERVDGRLKFFGTIRTNRGPQRREVPDYSNDLTAMWAAEHYLKSLGLGPAYLAALAETVGAADPNDPEDLFRMVCASPAQRCGAALAAHERRGAEGEGWPGVMSMSDES